LIINSCTTVGRAIGTTKKLQNVYRQKVDALAALKRSLLQKAFTGELMAGTEKVLEAAAE
jgi:hypothetical protein